MDLREWQEPATEIRTIARPRDPIVAKEIENILKGFEAYPPECDDLGAIDDACQEYGIN